ncbi:MULTISPECIES: ABC transporter ATP-binding protein [Pseudomonas]|jgi:ATP-binding cassette subfamily B protein|uniref:ATP-binding cassette, subfamily B n=3 Tax=Pseudomonas fluorescens group TaxID=136843 RepID=A0ABY0V8R3_9PSED|nr:MULTISPECIES: ABC transporter ATP-binding protein [Pseudomonas]MBU0522906.1 ABC transporter ATP-binding protein/permease [Gammaproteobacteria bacterium]MDF9882100.1 ATP-binding cassette subfamily B protein [Pseudomonas silensiensis]AHZ68524.1 ABC transporter, transmembrane region [Pseudomonas mandelii JR-1]MBU0817809.1 ABC transporter ATP-binding protein/permease [Gammaproteobacteria bacterium]MBU0843650.1 ABC transporter ATP-binding protein/permease [Gammaproteobacteria bacterium]
MQRLIVRLIDSQNPEALQAALRWLYSFVRPHRLAIAGLLGLSVCASSLVLVQPWLTKLLIDDGLLAKNFPMLVLIAGLMILAGLLGTALSGINRYLHTRLSGRILFSLRDDLYRHLQTLSPSFYGQRRIGDLMSRLDGDVAEIQRFAVDSLFSAVSSVVGLVVAVAMLLTLSWKLSLLALVLIPLDILWLRWMRRKVERDVRQLRERSADMSSFMVETLPVMKFIQSAGQQQRESRRLESLGQGYMSQLLRLQVTEFFTQAVPGTLTSLSRACAFLIGGYWVVQGTWQLGALIAFSTYLGMAVGPVQSLLGLYVAIQRMTVSLGRVMELRGEEPTVLTPVEPKPMPTSGELRFDDVHFSHPGRPTTLRGIEARIPYGLKVALSGGSGVGKSTLIDLLQRHHDPQAGRVLLGEVDLRELDLFQLRRRIAVVSQDIVLFRGSLADNLAYAVPDASREAIAEVARLAQLDSLIESLPEGLDSPLGERGQQLSGGQKQRIAIARALLQDPLILVLDEATSAVDEATEREVIEAIDRLFAGRTRILISHRPSTLADADVRFELLDGVLISKAVLHEA